jgi:drug/metabolite transporter (DMT)-like permease
MVALIQRPRWLLGTLAEVAGYVTQVFALRKGSLILVQTVLVSGLLFALPLGAFLNDRPMRGADWLWAVLVVVALAVFVAVAVPKSGRDEASGRAWLAVLAVTGGIVVGLVVTSARRAGPQRATGLATACGVLFGLDAALTKACGHLLATGGLSHLLRSWEPYTLAGLAAYGLLLAQSAFQAGQLGASLPALTIADPLAASAIGVFAFHERIRTGALGFTALAASVVAMVAGVFVLSRSPAQGGELRLHRSDGTAIETRRS